jgi:hypothetical protein
VQFPFPSQPPAWQVDADAGQALSVAPGALFEQVPGLVRLHDAHVPQDEDVQHTPSVQYSPAAHWEVAVHAPPLVVAEAQAVPSQPFVHGVDAGVEHTPPVWQVD